MMRLRAGVVICVGFLLWTGICLADDSSPQEVLKSKELVATGMVYALPAEAEIADGMKNLRTVKKKVDDDAKARKQLEGKLSIAKNAISQWEYQRIQLNAKLAKVTDAAENNHLIAQINILSDQIKQVEDIRKDLESQLNGIGTEDDTNYVNSVIDLNGKADEAAKTYAELAKDPQVKSALADINKSGHGTFRIGPNQTFIASLNLLRKWRKDVTSDVIALTIQNNVPVVDVTLNGKVTRSMVVDSGASFVSLTADLARELEMVPTEKDQTIQMTLADGRVVEGKLMSLKTVRVGSFTVDDVECAVLPESLTAAEPLLGGTFLKNFIYRMDQKASQLHLSTIAGTGKAVSNVGKSKPDMK